MHSSHSRRSSRTWIRTPQTIYMSAFGFPSAYRPVFYLFNFPVKIKRSCARNSKLGLLEFVNGSPDGVEFVAGECCEAELGGVARAAWEKGHLYTGRLFPSLNAVDCLPPFFSRTWELINNSKLNWLILVVLIRCVQNMHIITPMPLFSCEILCSTYLLYVLCLATDLRSHILRFNCSTNETYVFLYCG